MDSERLARATRLLEKIPEELRYGRNNGRAVGHY